MTLKRSAIVVISVGRRGVGRDDGFRRLPICEPFVARRVVEQPGSSSGS
jgi:hypothetical protein